MRVYLNRPGTNEFFDTAKELNADYIESYRSGHYAVFKGKPTREVYKFAIALALYDDGTMKIGSINPSCDNFEEGRTTLHAEDAVWLNNVIEAIKAHTKVHLQKK